MLIAKAIAFVVEQTGMHSLDVGYKNDIGSRERITPQKNTGGTGQGRFNSCRYGAKVILIGHIGLSRSRGVTEPATPRPKQLPL